ncbi:MAG TPA: MarR family transcriptional regulator, partial [Actinobacteria bacterium]|nr:MarR family transcriptional regulator [Actinomycetota bacterium]
MTVDPLAFEKAALARPVSDGLEVDDEVMAAVFDMIRVVNRLLRDFDAHVYRPEGVTWAGFRVLFCLWVEPDVAPARLAVLSGVSRATISSVVNTLERKGLVTRDRRS